MGHLERVSFSMFQPTRENLDLHSVAAVNERARDRRLRFQLPSFRFASYRNSMYCELSVRQTEKRSHRAAFGILFYIVKLVFDRFFPLSSVHSHSFKC